MEAIKHMARTLTKFRITAKNGAVLGIFPAYSQLEAWQQCCKTLGIRDEENVTTLEPGITFTTVSEREWKPTHTIINGATRIDVQAEPSDGFPNVQLLYTREEWLAHDLSHWDLIDGKKLRRNGKETSFAWLQVNES